MPPEPPGPSELRALAARLKRARHLSPALRRYWLGVLPHLRGAERARLAALLDGG